MIEQIEPALSELIITSYEGGKNKQNGCYEGEGKATFDTGCSYEGNFKNGMMHGVGIFNWPDGVSYEGDFVNGKMQGKGKYTWSDGSTYEGGITDGKRNGGDGIFTCSAGQIYDGDWVNGKRHGRGQMWYTNNYEQVTHYTGDWVTGLRDGFGVMTYPSGNRYEGKWKADKKSGRGVMTWNATNEVYAGDWKEDKPHGRGEHIWGFDGGSRGGVGQAKAGRQICNIYRGEWSSGVRSGFGTFFYSNGSQYSGNWKDNTKHGEGVFIFPDGRIYVGDFEKDRMIADGTAQANPRATDDVSPQTRLNVADAIAKCPWNKATSGNVPAPTTKIAADDALRSSRSTRSKVGTSRPGSPNKSRPNTGNSVDSLEDAFSIASLIDIPARLNYDNFTNDLERLLLRYHQYTKSLYLRYADLAAVERLNRADLDLSKTDPYITEWPEVEKIIFKARNIYSRMLCMDLNQMYRFCHELGIIGSTFHVYNVTKCFREMKISQRHAAKVALQDHRARKANQSYDPYDPENSSKTPPTPTTLAFPRSPYEKSLEFLLEVDYLPGTPPVISPSSLRQVPDNIMLPPILDQRRVMARLEIDPRQPILFREFVELLVRVLMEKGYRDHLRAQSRATTYGKMNRIIKDELTAKAAVVKGEDDEQEDPYKEVEDAPVKADPWDEEIYRIEKARKKATPFDVVFQQLAQKVYPLSTDRTAVAPFFAIFYHGRVQDSLKRNEECLKKLWDKLVERARLDNVVEAKQGASVAEIRHFLQLIQHLKDNGSTINPSADPITVLLTLERIAVAFSDMQSEAPNLAASQALPPPPLPPTAGGNKHEGGGGGVGGGVVGVVVGGHGVGPGPTSRVSTALNGDSKAISALLEDDADLVDKRGKVTLGGSTASVTPAAGAAAASGVTSGVTSARGTGNQATGTTGDAEVSEKQDERDDGGVNPLFYKIPYSEFACVGMKINYVDFTEILSRIMISELWVFKPPLPPPEESKDTDVLARALDALTISAVDAAASAVEESKTAPVPALDLNPSSGSTAGKGAASKPGTAPKDVKVVGGKKGSIIVTPPQQQAAVAAKQGSAGPGTPAPASSQGTRSPISGAAIPRRGSKEKTAAGSSGASPAPSARNTTDEGASNSSILAIAEGKYETEKEFVDPEINMSQDEKLAYRLDKWLPQLDAENISLLTVSVAVAVSVPRPTATATGTVPTASNTSPSLQV